MNALYTGPSPEDLDRIPDALKAPPSGYYGVGQTALTSKPGK
jgi:hypothetical protein